MDNFILLNKLVVNLISREIKIEAIKEIFDQTSAGDPA
jgi:hypothetical protein